MTISTQGLAVGWQVYKLQRPGVALLPGKEQVWGWGESLKEL